MSLWNRFLNIIGVENAIKIRFGPISRFVLDYTIFFWDRERGYYLENSNYIDAQKAADETFIGRFLGWCGAA